MWDDEKKMLYSEDIWLVYINASMTVRITNRMLVFHSKCFLGDWQYFSKNELCENLLTRFNMMEMMQSLRRWDGLQTLRRTSTHKCPDFLKSRDIQMWWKVNQYLCSSVITTVTLSSTPSCRVQMKTVPPWTGPVVCHRVHCDLQYLFQMYIYRTDSQFNSMWILQQFF